jgi:hypothetical protein
MAVTDHPRPPEKPVAVIDLVDAQPRLEHDRVRDHHETVQRLVALDEARGDEALAVRSQVAAPARRGSAQPERGKWHV